MKLGKWKSKTSELVVRVLSATDDVVWWENKAIWSFPCQTTLDAFLYSMEPVEAENLSSSNAESTRAGNKA